MLRHKTIKTVKRIRNLCCVVALLGWIIILTMPQRDNIPPVSVQDAKEKVDFHRVDFKKNNPPTIAGK